jgi:hydroxymethylglutaryl-CoA reductase (NADPH)
MKIPSLILQRLYTVGSLENEPSGGVRFQIKNRLSDAELTAVRKITVNGEALDLSRVTVTYGERELRAAEIDENAPLRFPLGAILRILSHEPARLEKGSHELGFEFQAQPFGKLSFRVKDAIAEKGARRVVVPYDKEHDYDAAVIERRQRFIEEFTGHRPKHLFHYSFEPELTAGNIENFTGVAQVPIGLAGPLTVLGEHAHGDFLIPMATAEGTLVASYNRGMKVVNLSGGVTCTVQDDCMQRAPVFIFHSAREAREFRLWVEEHMPQIREAAEATSSVAKLLYIDIYLAAKFAYLRFNFATGDAAGQNMVGRATFAACSWILEHNDTIRRFYLESNLATDKKASQVNIMRTRGKRVTAELTIPRDVLVQHMRVEPESLQYHAGVANVGAFISGANNNGLHSPNGITAMFIATGQDVANVSESSAGIIYTELTPDGDLYLSLTLPSLIVASYGGGTGLATQRECLEILGCYGKGRVRKFAEIVAGVALAGEISLAAAISSLDWVSSHEQYGRNR